MNEAYDIISTFVELTEGDREAEQVGTDLWENIQKAREWLGETKNTTTYGQLV